MKPLPNLASAIAALFFVILCGCGGKSKPSAGAQNDPPGTPQSPPLLPAVSKTFSIKGFYIGMTLQEARRVAVEKAVEIGVTNLVTSRMGDLFDRSGKMINDHEFEIAAPSARRIEYPVDFEGQYAAPLILVVADPNDTVAYVSFRPTFINNSFNVGDLDAEAFAKQIIANYGIPQMDPLNGVRGYFYIDVSSGFEVKIEELKGQFNWMKYLSLRRIPKRTPPAPATPFSIEGFYVGMPLEDARQIATNDVAAIGLTQYGVNTVITIRGDTDHRMTEVIFPTIYVDHRWFSGDVNEFAHEIIEYYGIPSMDPLPDGGGYSYRNLNEGFEVRIQVTRDRNGSRFRSLHLIKTPKSIERHFEH